MEDDADLNVFKANSLVKGFDSEELYSYVYKDQVVNICTFWNIEESRSSARWRKFCGHIAVVKPSIPGDHTSIFNTTVLNAVAEVRETQLPTKAGKNMLAVTEGAMEERLLKEYLRDQIDNQAPEEYCRSHETLSAKKKILLGRPLRRGSYVCKADDKFLLERKGSGSSSSRQVAASQYHGQLCTGSPSDACLVGVHLMNSFGRFRPPYLSK